jgi:hypothetical protein
MTAISRILTGAAAAALTIGLAAPAQAQYDDRYRRGSGVQDVVSAAAAVAAVVSAVTNQGRYRNGGYDPYGRGGYDPYARGGYSGYGHNRGYEDRAVQACGYEADRRYARYGGARIQVQHVEQYRRDRLRVHGTAEVGNDYRGGYGRYDRSYGNSYAQRVSFTCTARLDGRVSDFRVQRYGNGYGYGY